MKSATSGFKVLLSCLLFILTPSLMFANSATVDCVGLAPGTFTTISAALATFPPAGPNDINVTCNTTDNVLIVGFSNLTIFSAIPPGPFTVTAANANRRVLNITNSTNISVDGLVFAGGRGVVVNNSTAVALADGGIQGSSLTGLTSLNSVVDVFSGDGTTLFTVQNNTRSGITAQGGVMSLDGGVTVANNARAGINMLNGHLLLNGGDGGVTFPNNVISNNGLVGVSLADSAECDAGGGNDVLNNGSTGVQVIHTSTMIWGGGGTIIGNKGVGVHIGETSHGEFDTVSITGNGASAAGIVSGFGAAGGMEVVENSDMFIDGGVNVANNQSTGILVTESSVLSSLGGNTINNNTGDGFLATALAVVHFFAADTATGNTTAPLECDTSSVLLGDTTGLGKTKCKLVP